MSYKDGDYRVFEKLNIRLYMNMLKSYAFYQLTSYKTGIFTDEDKVFGCG